MIFDRFVAGQLDLLVIITEVRKDENGEVDEVLMYVNDRCIFHLETMSQTSIWFVMHPNQKPELDDERFWIDSKNGRSHIQIKEE